MAERPVVPSRSTDDAPVGTAHDGAMDISHLLLDAAALFGLLGLLLAGIAMSIADVTDRDLGAKAGR